MTPDQMTLSLGIAIIPALASIAAAFVSSRFANRARLAETESTRLRELEERLAGKKYDMYEPILRGLGQMMLPGNATKALPEVEKAMPDFMTFIAVWGSDKALRAFSRYRLGSSTEPPAEIALRLVTDFMLAAREDLRSGPTQANGIDLLGSRINDLYAHPDLVDAFTLPFDDLARKHRWEPPWGFES